VTDQLLHFDSEIDLAPAAPVVKVETKVAVVQDRVVVRSEPKTSYLAIQPEDWGWEELRDYVANETIKRFGVFPRDPKKEFGIFKSFCERWGDRAVMIAKFAFEIQDGRWRGAPVKMTRFCKASDPYFATLIDEYLRKHT
jgi:hypothetical protein